MGKSTKYGCPKCAWSDDGCFNCGAPSYVPDAPDDGFKYYIFEDGELWTFDTKEEMLADIFENKGADDLAGIRFFQAKELTLKVSLEDKG